MLAGGKFAAGVRDRAPGLLRTCRKAQRHPASRSCRGQRRWDLQEWSRHFPSPQKPPAEWPERSSEPPSAAWLAKKHLLGFSRSVLPLSYIALPVLYLELFFKCLEQRAFCYSPWETKSQADPQPARASSTALIRLSLISLKTDFVFCSSLNNK